MSVNILNKIISQKKLEINALMQFTKIDDFENVIDRNFDNISMIDSIKKSKNGIISEFKRRSPSKKEINYDISVLDVATKYQKCNTAAMSILTDTQFFGGTTEDVKIARSKYKNPILRKDFIISEFQIYQAKAIGANAILLIAAVLTKAEMENFSNIAKKLNLEVLVEIHDINEIIKIPHDTHVMYGINNRNLKNFEVDFSHSIKLQNLLPKNCITIAESGISKFNDILMLRNNGFDGFLIGEMFMKMNFENTEIENFINDLENEN